MGKDEHRGRRTRIATAAWAAVVLAVPAAAQAADRVALTTGTPSGAPTQGFWGDAVAAVGGDNYIVGRFSATSELRNFFTFDLRTVATPIESACLRLQRASGSGRGVVELQLRETTSGAAAINADVGFDPAIFADLADGPLLGSTMVAFRDSSALVTVPLNEAGVRALRAVAGSGDVTFGGSLVQPARAGFLFGSSGGPQSLVLNPASEDCDAPRFPNAEPVVAGVDGPGTLAEGETGEYVAQASDPDGDELTSSWTVEGPGELVGPGDGTSARVRALDGPGEITLTHTADDGNGGQDALERSVATTNVAPVITGVALTGAEQAACLSGTTVGLTAAVEDAAGDADPLATTVDWGDGSSEPLAGPAEHSYATAGRYEVTVTASDGDGGTDIARRTVSLRYAATELLGPLAAKKGSKVLRRKAGAALAVRIQVSDCDGRPVPGLALVIGTTREADPSLDDPLDVTPSRSRKDVPGRMRDMGDGSYRYGLSTRGLAPGLLTVVVRGAFSGGQRTGAVLLR